MAYSEENMKIRRGVKDEIKEDDGPLDPYAELFRITSKEKNGQEEGNVTNSLAMLTAIPEVDLGMEYVSCFSAPLHRWSSLFTRKLQYSIEEYRGDGESKTTSR